MPYLTAIKATDYKTNSKSLHPTELAILYPYKQKLQRKF
jgi:hypothetical protein